MRTLARISALLLAAGLAQPVHAQGQPIRIFGLVELSGTGATSGTNFNDGVKLAVKEINAAGGILGRKIEYTANDTQSQPQIAKALAVKAIDDGAYVVMGPVFSGSILVSMGETRRAGIPNFTGGEAAAITQQGNPYVLKFSREPVPHGDAWPYVRALVDAFTPDRCLWGSDWPYLRAPGRVDYGVGLALAFDLFPDSFIRRKLLWDTPRELFGFAS